MNKNAANSYGDYSYLRIGRAEEITDKKQRLLYRLFEIFPGFIAWLTLIVLISLAVLKPVWIAVFIIIFDLYWLFRTIYLLLFLRVTYKKMRRNLATDWVTKLKNLSPGQYSVSVSNWQDLFHLVFLPMYQEDEEVVRSTFLSLLRSDYPKEKIIIVLAIEERAGQKALAIARNIEREFAGKFGEFFVTSHPADVAGEVPGKGANLAWAGAKIKNYIDEQKISYERIVVSALDIDTQVSPGYFSCLSYVYLTTQNPTRASYQPIPFYNNNIWQAPALARVMAYSSTFWHMMQQERPEQQTTFSSHSMSFQALVDVGFWQSNMVSEDSRIFFQCLFRYNGDYRVVSLYYPVSMDANIAPTFKRTMANLYKQQRRWAWGAENIPYVLFACLKNKVLPLKQKLSVLYVLIEGFHAWATNSIIIFMLGWLPLVAGGSDFHSTILSFSLPRLTGLIMTVSMTGIITSAVLTIILMPAPPNGRSRLNHMWVFLQWLITPLVFIIFSAIPALDAQTRLMLGKYMGFWVTEKSRN